MSVGMVAFWGLVICGVVWLTRHASAVPPGPTESPQQVLKRRLASGEISVDEYDTLRTVIDDTGAPSADRGAGSLRPLRLRCVPFDDTP
jgi:hypothetical protein